MRQDVKDKLGIIKRVVGLEANQKGGTWCNQSVIKSVLGLGYLVG